MRLSKFRAEGAGAPLPAHLDSIDSFDSLDNLERIDGIEIIERIDDLSGRVASPLAAA